MAMKTRSIVLITSGLFGLGLPLSVGASGAGECKELRYFSPHSPEGRYLQATPGRLETSANSKLPKLYPGVGLCVEDKGPAPEWLRVSVADQRQFSGWVLAREVMSDSGETAFRERFRIGRTESKIHGDELVFRDGESAIFLGSGGSNAPISAVRLNVGSVSDSIMGDGEEGGDFKSGKYVSAVGEFRDGMLVASTKLDKNPKSATWTACEPPRLSLNWDENTGFMEKVEAGKGPALPEPTTCRFQFAGKSIEIEHRMIGFVSLKDSIQYKARTVMRIDGKETQISGDEWVKLKWAGDINGDNQIDVIFSYGSGYNQGESIQLWMFDPASSQLKIVSGYVTYGC